MRLILVTGKGGVGKTSVAAATALRSAQLGHRTLVMSTDSAHSLGDSFDIKLSAEAQEILPNLRAQEVNILREMDAHWGTLQRWLKALLAWRGIEEVVAGEIAILPGMEELAGLLYMLQYYEDPSVDVMIVDCAPTGETLRLLSFPDVMRWWLSHIYPIERKVAQVIRPIARNFWDVPLPQEEVFDAIRDLGNRLIRMRAILTNPEEASVRLVVNPEKMVIQEAQRTFTYLNLYGYFTELIVTNRVLPATVTDPYFRAWQEGERHYQEVIHQVFSPVPIRPIPLMEREVVGTEMLQRVADALYGDEDPTQFYYRGKSREFFQVDGQHVLEIPLPFVEKGDITLTQRGDELSIQVGNQMRKVFLPHTLAAMKAANAKFQGEKLRITFSAKK